MPLSRSALVFSKLNQTQNSRFCLDFWLFSCLSFKLLCLLYRPLLWQIKRESRRMKRMQTSKMVTAKGSGRGSIPWILARMWLNFGQKWFCNLYSLNWEGTNVCLADFTCIEKGERKVLLFTLQFLSLSFYNTLAHKWVQNKIIQFRIRGAFTTGCLK